MSKKFKVVANDINIGNWIYKVDMKEFEHGFNIDVTRCLVDENGNAVNSSFITRARFKNFNDSLNFFAKLLGYLKNYISCPEDWNENQYIETIDYNLMLFKEFV